MEWRIVGDLKSYICGTEWIETSGKEGSEANGIEKGWSEAEFRGVHGTEMVRWGGE